LEGIAVLPEGGAAAPPAAGAGGPPAAEPVGEPHAAQKLIPSPNCAPHFEQKAIVHSPFLKWYEPTRPGLV